MTPRLEIADDTDRAVCSVICQSNGIKAREIARRLSLDRKTVNHVLFASPLLKEICWQDIEFQWHGIIRQERPHFGLQEFSGYYGFVKEFTALDEDTWMARMIEGCTNIGRSLNDNRGLMHSFRDCRAQMIRLFDDLQHMGCSQCMEWEIAFEFRLKRSKHIRIYADVLVITDKQVFSLEFKMKNEINPDEVWQSAKYTPYLEIVFGPGYDVIPALVLTSAAEFYEFVRIGKEDAVIPVCSGDMLFNVFDEYLGFLAH